MAAQWARHGAHDSCRRLLARARIGGDAPMTAIVAANDLLALGCLDVCHERGLSCPETLSLTGVMDLPHMDLINPALTTVRIDSVALGEDCATLLLRRLAGEAVGNPALRQPATLVVRASTAPPPR